MIEVVTFVNNIKRCATVDLKLNSKIYKTGTNKRFDSQKVVRFVNNITTVDLQSTQNQKDKVQ